MMRLLGVRLLFCESITIALSFFFAPCVCAQTIVRTSQELQDVLGQEKEVGIVLLDGDWFHIEGVAVNMGGKIKPYDNKRPILVGFQQTVNKRKDTKVQNGYWTAQIKGYGAANYIFLDEDFDAVERSKKVDGKEYIHLKASDLQRVDKATRNVKIKIPSGYESLKNKSESELKNAMLKVGYWFVQMNIYKLKSDSEFLYGQIDNSYNYDLLETRPDANLTISFFNYPYEDGGAFLDGSDVLHVPEKFASARLCCSNNILTLIGDRQLTIEGITFVGSKIPVEIGGSNKHISNCCFKNCGSGVHCDYGVTNKESGCTVSGCSFENLYNNNAITFVGCDNVIIENNRMLNTGIVNRGGCVIEVGGNNFRVEHNIIKSYSYIGIYAGISREYAKVRMTGCIKDNIIDNADNWGKTDKQLTDGGGIYVITHTDGVLIENNIVRNIGYEGCELKGIYLDDGAYNCTVRRNLVYNVWPGQYAITARYVDECEHSCINNVFDGNIFIGPCKMAGNRKDIGNKTIIRNNYIAGELITQGDEYVMLEENKFVSATVRKNGKIVFENGNKVRKRGFSKSIRKLIK